MCENKAEEDKVTIVPLQIQSVHKSDEGSQKCRLNKDTITSLNVELGSFVKIDLQHHSYICSVSALCEESDTQNALFDSTVSCTRSENNSNVCSIIPISCSKATCISIDVVVEDYSNYRLWKNPGVLTELQNKCLRCLRNMTVGSDSTVDLKHSRLASFYGIKFIVVNTVDCESTSEGACVHSNTEINVDRVISEVRFNALQRKEPKHLGGVTQVMDQLLELIDLPFSHSDAFWKLRLPRPQGILLRGPPGCGKTTIVKSAAYHCQAALVSINGPEVLGSRPGETEDNLREVFAKAKSLSLEGACILFIDEIDTVCPKRYDSNNAQDSRITSATMSCMDELLSAENLVVIGATNRPSAIDPALRRPGRLEREILMNVPTTSQRLEILTLLTQNLLTSELCLDHIADITNGFVGADLVSLCNEASYSALTRSTEKEKCPIRMQDFHSAMKKVVPTLRKGVEGLVDVKKVEWKDIGGLEEVKQQIRQAVEWPMLHPEAFKRFGLPVSKGVLLYGPPGCCKTTLVRAAATASHTTFLALSGAQLFSPYVGESERIVTETFQKARTLAPSIVFLDEIDSIVGRRSEGGSSRGVQERLLSTLLNEMDGIGVRLDDKVTASARNKLLEGSTNTTKGKDNAKTEVDNSRVLVVAATNRPDLVDAALLRPGRLDRIVYVPHPDYQTRKDILDIQCKRIPVHGVDTEYLAAQTDYYTGADLASLCREASMLAMTEDLEARQVRADHFQEALKIVKPSLNDTLIEKYKNIHFNKRDHISIEKNKEQ